MGGPVPLGYDLGDRELLVNPREARQIREIFETYLEVGSVRRLKDELDRRGMKTKRRRQKNGKTLGAGSFSRGHLYRLLANPIYRGKLPHKDQIHEGRHEAIIDERLWNQVHEQLRENKQGKERKPIKNPSLLAGLLRTPEGARLIASHAVKKGRRYRYYIEQSLTQDEGVGVKGVRYAAFEIENAVVESLRRFLGAPQEVKAAFGGESLSPSALRGLLPKARGLAQSLSEVERCGTLPLALLNCAVVHPKELELQIRRGELARHLDIKTEPDASFHNLRVPCRLARRGQELKFVLPLEGTSEQYMMQDPALIRAVAKAHLWWQWIRDGEVKNLTEIAAREGLDKAQITRRLPLAFLSPRLVERILGGAQPAGLTLETLLRKTDLPLAWAEQEQLLS